jgi:2-amino-4-hydroxy-6-hydroxymethyldihydropteridine diphosphokinase
LLLYADARIETPALCVPHPRLHTRAFVLAPLADCDGASIPAGPGRRVAGGAGSASSLGGRRAVRRP